MSNDPAHPNTPDQEKRDRMPWAKFVPEPGVPGATKEQIADFNMARIGWTEEDRDNFYATLANLNRQNPNDEKKERVNRTSVMRDELREDLAKDMSPEEIHARLRALDLPQRLREFEKGLASAKALDVPKVLKAFCEKEAAKVLEIEHRFAVNAYDKRQREERLEAARETSRRDGRGDRSEDIAERRSLSDSAIRSRAGRDAAARRYRPLTEAHKDSTGRPQTSPFRERGNDVTRWPSGSGRGGRT